ncbi:MAG: GNAT family N-acetyltransferase, partial [Gemmatimonas sp.]
SIEIAYFGLAPDFIGRGLGKAMLTRAVQEAFALGPVRVWLHTCTLDSPRALPNYLARGFTPTRRERYVAELTDD